MYMKLFFHFYLDICIFLSSHKMGVFTLKALILFFGFSLLLCCARQRLRECVLFVPEQVLCNELNWREFLGCFENISHPYSQH